jgi:hypothetical protein
MEEKSFCVARTYSMSRNNDPRSLIAKADQALEDACRNVIERARRCHTTIIDCRAGKIVKLTQKEATVTLEANLAKRKKCLPY